MNSSERGLWAWRFAIRDSQFAISNARLLVEGAEALALDGPDHLQIATGLGNFALPLLSVVTADGTPLDLPTVQPTVNGAEITAPFSPLPSLSGSVSPQGAAGLTYATFLGGSDWDEGRGIALDESGAAYVTGWTWSSDFPTTPGDYDTDYNGNWDVFVGKLSPDGSSLYYATFLGGGDSDFGYDIALDESGAAYVTGETLSSDFPTTPGAYDTDYNGGDFFIGDAFVGKLSPDGSSLYYATFLGGSSGDSGRAIALDGSGAAYVTGRTWSSDFPTTPGDYDTSYNGGEEAFVGKLSPDGGSLYYATFIGGSIDDSGSAIVLDASGAAYVTGATNSSDFPTMPGSYDTSYNGGYNDAFVSKLSPDGGSLYYSTFLGGSNSDSGSAIALDGSGATYVTGATDSSNFPTTPGAYDTGYNGGDEAFVGKLSPDGSSLYYATFLGGSSSDSGEAVAVDGTGAAYVAGWTSSSNFPTTPGAYDTSYNGGYSDAFISKLASDGDSLSYSTFVGGSSSDLSFAIAMDEDEAAYVTGATNSSDFPTTPGAYDTSYNGGDRDVFVVKLPMGLETTIDIQQIEDFRIVDRSLTDGGENITFRFKIHNYGSESVTFQRIGFSGHKPNGDYYDKFNQNVTVTAGGDYVFDETIFLEEQLGTFTAKTTYQDLNGGWHDLPKASPGIRDSISFGVPEVAPALVYDGPWYLPADNVMVDEDDGRISMGDHVHLRLPFKNTSSRPLSDATIEVEGQGIGSSPSAWVYNEGDWQWLPQTISLTPETIGPGEIGTADFWIYIPNRLPEDRQSLYDQTLLNVRTDVGQWTISISLSPIYFLISGNETLKSGSCLHNPVDFEIEKYAQYAAAPLEPSSPPTNSLDADTQEQAIRNLVSRVNDPDEFEYQTRGKPRRPDTDLLKTRGGQIGACYHYADLTIGLLRSLGFPSRYVTAWLTKPFWMDTHAWTETYVGDDGWRQADSTMNYAFQESIFEENGITVRSALGDKHALGSASMFLDPCHKCVSSCYDQPVDCPTCIQQSNSLWPGDCSLSCVENVTAHYRGVSNMATLVRTADSERLLVNLQNPGFVTRMVSFTLASGIVNSTTLSLKAVTVTLASSDYVDPTSPLFEVAPSYQAVTDLNAGQTVTVTWVVTPLVTSGSGIPLQVAAESRNLFDVAVHPLVVNEPGTLPDLSLGGICGPGTISPGRAITLTAYVRDETLQPLTDTLTLVTATVYATPTLLFSTTLNLSYCETCGMYQNVLHLPGTAPIGNYQVDFAATHPGYEPDRATSFFFATPPLSLTLTTSQDVLDIQDTLILTAQVSERGTVVTEAGVWAEIGTPAGVVTTPLMIGSGDVYTLTFCPLDLAANLGGQILPGMWLIRATADYMGSNATTQTAIVVRTSLYLPLILKDY